MKNKALILQLVVWISMWLVFSLSSNSTDYLLHITTRVAGLALFYNLAYYALLPAYFSGKKRLFYVLLPLGLAGFIAWSTLSEWLLFRWDVSHGRVEAVRHQKPLVWIIIPPLLLGTSLFGIAASLRGFAAFEKKKEEEEEANRRRLEAELALLKSQINPHFLLNSLNNIYALAMTSPDKTPDALLKLSGMVAYILYDCSKPRVPLYRDLAFIQDYLALQQLRLSPNITLHTTLPVHLPEQLQIEPMILIPFIENAFKHGISARHPCVLEISVLIDKKKLTLHVENPMFPEKKTGSEDTSGFGLPNTRRRIEHTYPDRHNLDIKQIDGKYQVNLELILDEDIYRAG